jgi:hypothetical protein
MGASATIAGQNLGAHQPERAIEGVHVASKIGLGVAAGVGAMFMLIPNQLLALFGMTDPFVLEIGRQLLRFLSISGLFITVALCYTGPCRGLAILEARCISRSCRRSSSRWGSARSSRRLVACRPGTSGWRSSSGT